MKNISALITVAVALCGSALTLEQMTYRPNGGVSATISYAAADTDRQVLVAWGASDAGASYSAWDRAEYANGVCRAGSSSCRVVLPPESAAAGRLRLFLVSASTSPSYLRSTGKQYIRTDFYPTPLSKISADYQWEDTTTPQQRLFGVKKGINVHHYINGSGGLSWSYSKDGNWTTFPEKGQIMADTSRSQMTLDAKNKRAKYVRAGQTMMDVNMTARSSSAPGTTSATEPLNVFMSEHGYDMLGSARLYSLVCHDNDVLKQYFVPHFSDGVAGLRDTVSGKFYANELPEPFWAGAPASGVSVHETSAVVTPAAELAGMQAEITGDKGACLSFPAVNAVRELWCVWDASDKGESFGAWADNERVTVIPANATTCAAALPPRAEDAACVRFFLVEPKTDYECAYVRSDGGQAIDTGFFAGTDMAVTVDYLPNNTELVQQRMFGAGDITNCFSFTGYFNGSGLYAWSARNHTGNWKSTGVIPEKKRTRVTLDVPNDYYSLEVEGVQIYREAISATVPAKDRTISPGIVKLGIFCVINPPNNFSNKMIGELYGATVSTNGVLVRNYRPCVVAGVPGVRDEVSSEFVANSIPNWKTNFIPGGRTDVPVVLNVSGVVHPKTADVYAADVYASARFWLRGFGNDLNGNGVLNGGECRDWLRKTMLQETIYGESGHQPRFLDENVCMPGRGVSRLMKTIYFPQTITITNASNGSGYVQPSSIRLSSVTKGMTNKWTFVIRAKADLASAPADNSQWLLNFSHGSSCGVLFGFSGTETTRRRMGMYVGGKSVDISSIYVEDGWFDIALIADGQKIKIMYMRDGNGITNDNTPGIAVTELVIDTGVCLAPSPSNGAVLLGVETSISDKRLYPMAVNDNHMKAFRGSIQQCALWDRVLSDREVYAAFGWPRADLFRVGLEDGSADEFRGELSAAGVDADAEVWPLQRGVTRAQPLTVRFVIDRTNETSRAQFLRWKALAGEGRLALTLNGSNLGTQRVRPNRESVWFVDAQNLTIGTNTAVLTRTDSGPTALIPDVIAMGGGVQVGFANGNYSEFVTEGKGNKHLYSCDGNTHDVKRVLYCGNSANSNFYYHVTIPGAFVNDRQQWRFTLATAYASLGSLPKHPIAIDLNGNTLGVQEMKDYSIYTFDVPAEYVVPGENVFNLRNCAPAIGSNYLGIDYFALEPLRPTDGTIFLLR